MKDDRYYIPTVLCWSEDDEPTSFREAPETFIGEGPQVSQGPDTETPSEAVQQAEPDVQTVTGSQTEHNV